MKYKESIESKCFTIFNYVILMLFALTIIFPYLNVLARALNDGKDSMKGGITIYPREFTLDNIKVILSEGSFIRSFFVSVVRVLVGTVLGLLVQFTAAYALSKKAYPFKGIIVVFFMIPMYIGAGMLPTYVMYSKLGLLNSFWVYVLPGVFSFYNAVIIRSFMQSTIPDSLYESAYLDGANEVTVFRRIVIPLCKPVIATIGIWLVVAHWSDWTTTLYYIRDSKLYTMQYKMVEILKETERIQKLIAEAVEMGLTEKAEAMANSRTVTSDSLTCAQIILTTLPVVCVYPFLQKYFVKGTMLGAVKE